MAGIYFLDFDEDNEQHLAAHGISAEEVFQMLENRHMTMADPKGGEARILMLGESHGGRRLTLVLEGTKDEAVWRPVTGWPMTSGEHKLFERHCR